MHWNIEIIHAEVAYRQQQLARPTIRQRPRLARIRELSRAALVRPGARRAPISAPCSPVVRTGPA